MSVGTPMSDVFCSRGVVFTKPFHGSYVRAQPFDEALTASQRFLPPQVQHAHTHTSPNTYCVPINVLEVHFLSEIQCCSLFL